VTDENTELTRIHSTKEKKWPLENEERRPRKLLKRLLRKERKLLKRRRNK